MTELLTPRQREFVDAIRTLTLKLGYPPSVRELGAALKIGSPNGVMSHLRALVKKGVLVHEAGRGRSYTLADRSPSLPVLGRMNPDGSIILTEEQRAAPRVGSKGGKESAEKPLARRGKPR